MLTPDSHHYSERHLRTAKQSHIILLRKFNLREVFLHRQLFEYSHKHDGFRLTSEYMIPHLGSIMIGTLTNIDGTYDSAFNIMEKMSIMLPEATKWKTFHHKTASKVDNEGNGYDVVVEDRADDKMKFFSASIMRDYHMKVGTIAVTKVA